MDNLFSHCLILLQSLVPFLLSCFNLPQGINAVFSVKCEFFTDSIQRNLGFISVHSVLYVKLPTSLSGKK